MYIKKLKWERGIIGPFEYFWSIYEENKELSQNLNEYQKPDYDPTLTQQSQEIQFEHQSVKTNEQSKKKIRKIRDPCDNSQIKPH